MYIFCYLGAYIWRRRYPTKLLWGPQKKLWSVPSTKKSVGRLPTRKTVKPTKYLWNVLSTKLWNVWGLWHINSQLSFSRELQHPKFTLCTVLAFSSKFSILWHLFEIILVHKIFINLILGFNDFIKESDIYFCEVQVLF
jgi:hypothetical protein